MYIMKVSNDPLKTILKAILPYELAETDTMQSPPLGANSDKSVIRSEILDYVSRIKRYVCDDRKSHYMKMWEEILDINIIAKVVYDPGRQQGTDFNRNLVANIIHFMDSQKIYKDDYNASTMAIALEGDKDHSVRGALGKDPDSAIVSRLKRYFE